MKELKKLAKKWRKKGKMQQINSQKFLLIENKATQRGTKKIKNQINNVKKKKKNT